MFRTGKTRSTRLTAGRKRSGEIPAAVRTREVVGWRKKSPFLREDGKRPRARSSKGAQVNEEGRCNWKTISYHIYNGNAISPIRRNAQLQLDCGILAVTEEDFHAFNSLSLSLSLSPSESNLTRSNYLSRILRICIISHGRPFFLSHEREIIFLRVINFIFSRSKKRFHLVVQDEYKDIKW